MAIALELRGALANCGRDASTDDLLSFLSDAAPDVSWFELGPSTGLRAAAFDWQALIWTSASLITIGQALWAAYETFVRPRLESGEAPGSFLYVYIKGPGDAFAAFQLGREYENEDAFMHDFLQVASALRSSDEGPSDAELEWEFSNQDHWVPFKSGRSGRP